MVLCSSREFCIFEPYTNIQLLRGLDLAFASFEIKFIGNSNMERNSSQGLPRFPRKMVLYWLNKFGIIKPRTNIPWLRRYDLRLILHTSRQIYRKFQYKEKVFWKFQSFPLIPRKFCL